MTEFLKIGPFPIAVQDGAAGVAFEPVGQAGRTQDGGMRTNRRAVKRKWGFKTTPQSARTAYAITDLVWGRGNCWTFDSHMYSAKGLGPSSYGGSTAITNLQFKYGIGSLNVPAASTFVIAGAYTSGEAVSVSCWVRVSGVWTHYATLRTAAGVAANYVNGVSSGATFPWAFSSGTVTITGTATETYFDDLVIVPSLWPTTWPALVYTDTVAFSPLGRLNVSGAGIGDNASTVSCVGAVESLTQLQGYDGATWSQNLQGISFTLLEA